MDCPHIPLRRYGQFSERLHAKTEGRRIPITGDVEVTERCNLRCAHCYINRPVNDAGARREELTAAEWCRIIDEVVDEGCLWLLLTGGEPFVREDFLDIYTHAKRRGLLVSIFTNGTTVTPEIAAYLAEWCPFSVEISIYGRTADTHDRVTGVPGSHERCLRGVDLLLERRIPLILKTVVMTLNRHELEEMAAYAQELGVEFRFDAIINTRLDGGMGPRELRLSPREVVALDLADEKRMKEWRELWTTLGGPFAPSELMYRCGAGVQGFHIDSYGKLAACTMARIPSYDLRQGSFREGWQEFMPWVLGQKYPKGDPCEGCELAVLCGQCVGLSQVEHGCPDKIVDYLCEIAHLQAETFDFIEATKGSTIHGRCSANG